MFNYEKFQAYQLSVEYWEIALNITNEIPIGNSTLKDQLKRAAGSISLNIAEAYGRIEDRDRKRFFSIARGSAMECAAISDLIVKLEPDLNCKVMNSKKEVTIYCENFIQGYFKITVG